MLYLIALCYLLLAYLKMITKYIFLYSMNKKPIKEYETLFQPTTKPFNPKQVGEGYNKIKINDMILHLPCSIVLHLPSITVFCL
jgi:hypothetical protein